MAGFLMPGDVGYVQDGVHLNLPAEDYFPQGLGSTDLMTLFFKKFGWWWSSTHNRFYKRKSTKELLYGSGTHAIVLEGVKAYEERFVAAPHWDQIPDLFDTTEQAKAWLISHGFSKQSVNSLKKDDLIEAMIDAEVEGCPYKAFMLEKFRRSIGGRDIVSTEDDWSLRLLREVMLDPTRDDNEDIRAIFGEDTGYPTLAEVSIFHTLPNGIRRRWRIDRMFPAFDLDLKTLGNYSGRPLEFETGDLIINRGYDIQRAEYRYARQIAYEYIKAGRLWGGTLEQRAWLMTWPEEFPTWAWKWLFYQKPDSRAGRAPVLFPVHDDNDSERERAGAQKARAAMQIYMQGIAKWGLDKPWATVMPQHYCDETHDPERAIRFPSWADRVDTPTDAEAWDQEVEA